VQAAIKAFTTVKMSTSSDPTKQDQASTSSQPSLQTNPGTFVPPSNYRLIKDAGYRHGKEFIESYGLKSYNHEGWQEGKAILDGFREIDRHTFVSNSSQAGDGNVNAGKEDEMVASGEVCELDDKDDGRGEAAVAAADYGVFEQVDYDVPQQADYGVSEQPDYGVSEQTDYNTYDEPQYDYYDGPEEVYYDEPADYDYPEDDDGYYY
jgi:hypothetical protein